MYTSKRSPPVRLSTSRAIAIILGRRVGIQDRRHSLFIVDRFAGWERKHAPVVVDGDQHGPEDRLSVELDLYVPADHLRVWQRRPVERQLIAALQSVGELDLHIAAQHPAVGVLPHTDPVRQLTVPTDGSVAEVSGPDRVADVSPVFRL